MNNDKLLIIVIVLTLYLLCFRRSEGKENGDKYVCEYDEKKIQETVADMLGSDGIDETGKIKTVNLEYGLSINNKNIDENDTTGKNNFTLRLTRGDDDNKIWRIFPGNSGHFLWNRQGKTKFDSGGYFKLN